MAAERKDNLMAVVYNRIRERLRADNGGAEGFMKIIFIIVVTILFLFCLIMYAAFYGLLKEQFDMTKNDVHEKD